MCNSFSVRTVRSVAHNCGMTGYTKHQRYMTLVCNDCNWERSSTEYGFSDNDLQNLAMRHALGLNWTTDSDGRPYDEPMDTPGPNAVPVSNKSYVPKYSLSAAEAYELHMNDSH